MNRAALCVGLGIKFLGEAVGEFEAIHEAGLLVQAAEVTVKVNSLQF